MQKKTQTIKRLLGKISMVRTICYFQLKKDQTYSFLESEDNFFFFVGRISGFMHQNNKQFVK